jgi:hypothetical protein
MGVFRSERLVEVEVPELAPVAHHLLQHFREQGYQVVGKTKAGDWTVSITKGGMFKAAAGLKTALNVEISAQPGGTLVSAGFGVFGRRAVPALVTGLVWWPLLVGQAWGLIKQSGLDDEAINVVEAQLKHRKRIADLHTDAAGPPVPAEVGSRDPGGAGARAVGSRFCTGCGGTLSDEARFCATCGRPRLA